MAKAHSFASALPGRGATEAAEEYGCAAGGARLISGNLALHEALEAELAPVSYSALEASECEAVALSDHVPVIARFSVRSEPHSAIPSPVPGATL